MVGGAAKAKNIDNMIRSLTIYKAEAAKRGVGVQAHFAADTPANVINEAVKRVGPNNVKIIKDN